MCAQDPFADGSLAGLYGALDPVALDQRAVTVHDDLQLAPGAEPHPFGEQLAVPCMVVRVRVSRGHIPCLACMRRAGGKDHTSGHSDQPFHDHLSSIAGQFSTAIITWAHHSPYAQQPAHPRTLFLAAFGSQSDLSSRVIRGRRHSVWEARRCGLPGAPHIAQGFP